MRIMVLYFMKKGASDFASLHRDARPALDSRAATLDAISQNEANGFVMNRFDFFNQVILPGTAN